MIIYSSTAQEFRDNVDDNKIVEKIETAYIKGVGRKPGVEKIFLGKIYSNFRRFLIFFF